jgi:hypothetical protein
LSALKSSLCGRLSEPGIWPDGSPGLGSASSPAKRAAAARIDDLMVGGAEDLAHELLVRDRSAVERGGEMGVADLRLAPFHRAPFGFPLLQAAVEDRDIMRAEALQHPPGAGRAVQRRIVVDDEAVAVAEPERLHPAGELVLGGTCAAPVDASTISSRSMNTAPGICSASYSARAIPSG